MAKSPDPTVDYSRHKGRVNFERLRESGNHEALENYIEAFISKGHDPTDPRDEMYSIMGITPDYLDFMRHDMAAQKLANTDVSFNAAAQKQKQRIDASAPGVGQSKGKGKKLLNTFAIDDD